MSYRLFGAVMIVLGFVCISARFSHHYRKELENALNLKEFLNGMECELQYNLHPLPVLIQKVTERRKGDVSRYFKTLADELNTQIQPDVSSCINAAFHKCPILSNTTKRFIEKFGASLGQYSIDGQLLEIRSIRNEVEEYILDLRSSKKQKIKSYQTLSICIGTAIAIILF